MMSFGVKMRINEIAKGKEITFKGVLKRNKRKISRRLFTVVNDSPDYQVLVKPNGDLYIYEKNRN